MITVTDTAKNKFLSILEQENRQGQGLRVTARRGATPLSVEYGLAFVEPGQDHPADKVIDLGEFKIYIDPQSAPFLDGAIVDYVSGLNESGFKITNPKMAGPPVPKGPVAEKVQRILETRINPGVAMHGGHVSLVDVKDDIAYLRFGGGCQGCGMVDVTLKQGVEVMLKEAVPELKGVMDVTDHAGGKNPYYQPAK
ncbi:MAG: iron-sulfur cluster assembly accessory protein [Calditrichaeota bacterium]|nr:MAG: iron-sulfur cluster assembly accessory protein [Calditrichota bacterium]